MLISQIGTLLLTFYYGVNLCQFTYKDLLINILLKPVGVFASFLLVFVFLKSLVVFSSVSDRIETNIILLLLGMVFVDLLYVPLYYHFVFDTIEKRIIKTVPRALKQRHIV